MVGVVIGNYQIVRKLGEGGMGVVYLGQHTLLGRRAAIKVLLPALSARPDIVNRFFNEARAVTSISDPGIVQVFDFGYHSDGSAFIVMEFLEGQALDQRLAQLGRFQVHEALRLCRQIATSLAAAHAQHIIHRDLKPENIFLVRDAEVATGERSKILDFGIAKLSDEHPGKIKTHTGALMGTPVYMSPEQCRGLAEIDHRSDIYALGCVLFHLIVGRPPFEGEGMGDIISAHIREPAPPPSSMVAGIPASVDALLLRCLAKAPADRYQTMTELASAIGGVLQQVSSDGGYGYGASAAGAPGYSRPPGTPPPPGYSQPPGSQPPGTPPPPGYSQPPGSQPPGYASSGTPPPGYSQPPGTSPPGYASSGTPPPPPGYSQPPGTSPPRHAQRSSPPSYAAPTTLGASAGQVAPGHASSKIGRWIAGGLVLAAIGTGVAILGTRNDGATQVASQDPAPPPAAPVTPAAVAPVAAAAVAPPTPTPTPPTPAAVPTAAEPPAANTAAATATSATAAPATASAAAPSNAAVTEVVATQEPDVPAKKSRRDRAHKVATTAKPATTTTPDAPDRKPTTRTPPTTPDAPDRKPTTRTPTATTPTPPTSPPAATRTPAATTPTPATSPPAATRTPAATTATAPTSAPTAPAAPARTPPTAAGHCSKADFASVYDAAVPAPGAVRAALRALKACRDAGSISDAEFDRYQTALVAKL